MAKRKQIPSSLGHLSLLAPEMKAFCAAWKGNKPGSRQLRRFVSDWRTVAAWGGNEVPSQDSQHALISAVVCRYDKVDPSQIPVINDRTLVRPAQQGLDKHGVETRRGKQVVGSVLYSRTGCDTGTSQWRETIPEWVLRVDDQMFVQQEFPDFTAAWLAYARQLLSNRSDKGLVVRVWLHTKNWTPDPDRPGKLRRWADGDFTFKDMLRCIQRDTGVEVSERTVRGVVSKMCREEFDITSVHQRPSQGAMKH